MSSVHTLLRDASNASLRRISIDSRDRQSEVQKDASNTWSDDAIARSKVCSVPGADHMRLLQYARLVAYRRLLRDGCEDHQVKPFVFSDGRNEFVAENSGLEGFVFSQERFEQRCGKEASVAHKDHYVAYLCTVLEGEAFGQTLLSTVRAITSSGASAHDQHEWLIAAVREETETLRREALKLDLAQWGSGVRAYQIFGKAFNQPGFEDTYEIPRSEALHGKLFEDLGSGHISALRRHSFSAIRFLDTYEIGRVNAKGSAGGSPYSIRSLRISPEHGTSSAVQSTLERAYTQGLLSIFEVVPNHTACDAELLHVDPRLYIHTQVMPENPVGYFHFKHPELGDFWIRHGGYKNLATGERDFWTDTLQLDLSNPTTREYCISQVLDLIRHTNLDGIRIDSAYQMLNRYFAANWSGELSRELPAREFLEELVTRIKVEFPHVLVIAEAFTDFDRIAECGIDQIYGLTSMERNGGYRHQGWHEALVSADPNVIQSAIEREEFLLWQVGGPKTMCFWQHIDRIAIEHEFEGREWLKYVSAVLTILKPGSLSFYNGAEVCVDTRCPEDNKVSSFNIPWQIDWSRRELPFSKFIMNLLVTAAHLRDTFGEQTKLTTLYSCEEHYECPWVGYTIESRDPQVQGGVYVLANLSEDPVVARFEDPNSGRLVEVELGPRGPDGFELVQF